MYEPYVPPGDGADEPACACTADGIPCTADCERCPADCTARAATASYEPYDEPDGPSWSSTSSAARRRRRRSRTSSAGSSSWRRSSSTRSSNSSGGSSRRSSGKKAGAGLGAAATAAAGGIGALSSGGEDPGATDPEPYSTYSAPYSDPYAAYDDLQAVEDRAGAPIVSFRARQGGRLVVVTGTWPDSARPAGCRVEVTAVERADRVVLEASAPVTRWQVQQGRSCDPPPKWSTGTSYVTLDEPLGSRKVVTSGPLLRGGEEVDPAGAAPVPRR